MFDGGVCGASPCACEARPGFCAAVVVGFIQVNVTHLAASTSGGGEYIGVGGSEGGLSEWVKRMR